MESQIARVNPSGTPVISMRGIRKTFGRVIANDDIDLDLYPGRVRGLLGENGAGKTTLMEILYGLYSRDAGEIALRGTAITAGSPREALDHGIGMVHQHSMLVPAFSAAENFMVGAAGRAPFIDLSKAEQEVEELSSEYGLVVEPKSRVGSLTAGEAQRVEILRMLYAGAEILILDEPTSRLVPSEVQGLARIISAITERGGVVVLITHKLEEVLALCHDVTILRDGRKVADLYAADTSAQELAQLMVGRSLDDAVSLNRRAGGAPVLRLQGLNTQANEGNQASALKGVDLDVREGEILGLAGIDGNGQRELAEVVLGLRHAEGTVEVHGNPIGRPTPRRMADLGIGCIPADRHQEALFLELSVAENLVVRTRRRKSLSRFGVISRKGVRAFANEVMRRYEVRPADPAARIASLSGGNQQKCAIARELEWEDLRLLLVLQPTNGLDIGAARHVHERLIEARNAGVAILLISNELTEILQLSDRIVVMSHGRLGPVRDGGDVDMVTLGLEMGDAGVVAEEEKPLQRRR